MARRFITARQQVALLAPWRTATADFDPMKVTHKLRDEFYDWQGQQPEDRYDDHTWNLGMAHWPMIEDFLKDRYPAAHRGLMTGREDASTLLDSSIENMPEYAQGLMSRYDDEFGSHTPEPYSSADHQKLGYDPAEIAAGMVLLHNQRRDGLDNGYLEDDKWRLNEIAKKRYQMQRAYEQRQAAWYHTSPRRLPVGTDLVPGGGGHHDRFYRAIGDPGRANHVWVEDDPKLLKRWHDIDAESNYHYRVEPDGDPAPYQGDPGQGYVVPRARIVEELGPAKRRRQGAVEFPFRYTGYPQVATVHMPVDIAHYYRFNDGIDGTERDDKWLRAGKPTLTDQIAADGIQKPIEINTNGKHAFIIDGHHRLGVARRLGLSHVPVTINWEPGDWGNTSAKPIEGHLRQILADNPGPYRSRPEGA